MGKATLFYLFYLLLEYNIVCRYDISHLNREASVKIKRTREKAVETRI